MNNATEYNIYNNMPTHRKDVPQPEKNALFLDKKGEQCLAIISTSFVGWNIDVYNESGDNIAFLYAYRQPNNYIFLDLIYVYDKYRGRGIADKMNDLFESQIDAGSVVYGTYEPQQVDTDLAIARPATLLHHSAKNFYTRQNYRIIKYQDWLDHPFGVYPPYINGQVFVTNESQDPDTIVVKKVKQNQTQAFQEVDGVLVHVDMLASTQPDRGDR